MRAAAAFVACLGVAAVMATPTVHATDPDVGKGMVEIVASKGYACEEHFVTTDDGYILGVFRIPAGRNEPPPAPGSKTAKPVAFLQHGLLDSSYTWVNNFPTQSLGFLLADAGYDVWFGNSRGNFYSRRHTHLDPDKDAAFWAFDFDEMALSDLPAMLQYVQEVSGAKTLSYVGHSQGTTQAFAAFSSDPEWATTIDLFGALAPVAYVHHQGSILLSLAADLDVDKWAALFGIREFLPDASFLQKLDPDICSLLPTGCDVVLFFICGPTNNLNASRIDVYVSETPAGTSVQNLGHWAQGVRKETFEHYDYGCGLFDCENQKHYGQKTPPGYSLSNITVPTALFYGSADLLGDPTDVQQLMDDLPDSTVVFQKEVTGFAHLDFTWGKDANTLVYADLMDQMAKRANPPPAPYKA